MNKKSSFIKDALILCLITLLAGVLLGFFYEQTKEPIKLSNEQTLQNSFNEVLEGTKKVKDIREDILGASTGYPAYLILAFNAYDENNNLLGFIIETSQKGYGGEIKVLVGFDKNKKITGIAYPEVLQETPGLGMKVTSKEFYGQYIGKNADEFQIVKGANAGLDNEIDAVTGATRSSKAVNDCVNTASIFVERAWTLSREGN